jgi:hypothetical protein
MNRQLIKDIILERNPDALFLDDIFDEALVGSSFSCDKKYIAIYDSDKYIEIVMKEFNYGELKALKHYEEACEKSLWENTPTFFSDFRNIKEVPIDIDKNKTVKDLY